MKHLNNNKRLIIFEIQKEQMFRTLCPPRHPCARYIAWFYTFSKKTDVLNLLKSVAYIGFCFREISPYNYI